MKDLNPIADKIAKALAKAKGDWMDQTLAKVLPARVVRLAHGSPAEKAVAKEYLDRHKIWLAELPDVTRLMMGQGTNARILGEMKTQYKDGKWTVLTRVGKEPPKPPEVPPPVSP